MIKRAIRIAGRGLPAYAAAAFALTSCHGTSDPDAKPTAPPPLVVVGKVIQESVPITQDFVGTTNAIDSIDVKARVQGTLESAPFKEGSLVHQGQLIFTIQPTQYQAALESAQAQLLKGQADLATAQGTVPVVQAQADVDQKKASLDRANITVARMRPLAADKAVPQKDLDNALTSQAAAVADLEGAEAQLKNATVTQPANIETAKAEILSAQASITNAKLNLSYTRIYAPVTGLIGFLVYDVGNVVGGTGNEVLDTITTVDPIKVNFAVDENTYLSLAGRDPKTPGRGELLRQPIYVLLSNNTTYEYPGRLYTVNPTLDAKTGTISVEARFPNPNAVLRPGQFARVRLVVEQRPNAVLVPQTAVVQTQGANTAYVLGKDDVLDLRSLTLGPQYKNYVVVDDGLSPGERVVVQGTQKVRPGIKVVVASPAPAH